MRGDETAEERRGADLDSGASTYSCGIKVGLWKEGRR